MSNDKLYLVTLPERLWHWGNVVLMILLILSGFNIHFARGFNIFGTLPTAITVHNVAGFAVIAGYLFWVVYLILSGRIRYYLPNREDLVGGIWAQAKYYLYGIFTRAHHPFTESVERKFNPLQKWTYLSLMGLLMPLQAVTGVMLYFFIANWAGFRSEWVTPLGILHTTAAFALTAFTISHIYLATTGSTVGAHFSMMLTGYAEHTDTKRR